MSDADCLKVPFSRPSLGKEEEQAVLDVMRSGWLTTGKITLAFEKEFSAALSYPVQADMRAAYGMDTRPVISMAVNSNTSGMILAMDACGVTNGTAVITTPYTFASTAMCARHLGAEVYFADTEKNSYSIDPSAVEKILEKDTAKKIKAIVPVHVGGNICDMQALCRIAKKYGVRIIEDAAHAFPSPTKLGYAGAIGDIGVFSFYVTKTITTGEGGMVCTRDSELAEHMTVMRMHGMDRTTWDRYTSPRASWEYDIIAPGYKFNLPDILSAIGREQLKKADTFYEKRKRIVEAYNEAFRGSDYLMLPPTGEGDAYHLYLIRIVPEKLTIDRNEFAKTLQKNGIGISVHFIPLFHFSYWKKRYPDFTAENYPNAERHYATTITLPLWPDMSDEMIHMVINAIKQTGAVNHV
jgi:dTDP-4-amino-4,6-dideoxygalactose transaminase